MVALFFVPVVVVVVVVVVVAIAERKRESVCVRKRNKCGEYLFRQRDEKEKKAPKNNKNQKGTQKLFPFPSPPLCSLFRSLFCLSEVNERERTEVNERKEE
jgi:hypothetical protein